ncbi:hypothetical protein EX30DRAFT_337653 [Ascodesmis nigricans]|uniref:Cytoplasmic protein n=1 Tax=Ascodesmis nigricans TaxID=341454 RepID=A0A4S2N7E2_9PEZI|nr:hypothetical protein EX30DRAFT_337653 [Ascodesmis nigricans]
MSEQESSPNYGRPLTDATLTIRVIKSFEYRTCKNAVLHHLDLTTLTAGELKEKVREHVKTMSGWKVYKNLELDTLKLYTKAQGTKTSNLIINMEDKDDSFVFRDDAKTLAEYGCEHETEISFFNWEAYAAFKANPVEKW